MSIAEVNRKRSERMKVYWKHIKLSAQRQGEDISDVRADFKGRIIPTHEGTHFTGKRYHYVAKVKHRSAYATVSSNKPLSDRQVQNRLSTTFNEKKKEDYPDDDRLYENGDFLIKPSMSSIDETVELKGEESPRD